MAIEHYPKNKGFPKWLYSFMLKKMGKFLVRKIMASISIVDIEKLKKSSIIG